MNLLVFSRDKTTDGTYNLKLNFNYIFVESFKIVLHNLKLLKIFHLTVPSPFYPNEPFILPKNVKNFKRSP